MLEELEVRIKEARSRVKILKTNVQSISSVEEKMVETSGVRDSYDNWGVYIDREAIIQNARLKINKVLIANQAPDVKIKLEELFGIKF
jgi:hypothetical protein